MSLSAFCLVQTTHTLGEHVEVERCINVCAVACSVLCLLIGFFGFKSTEQAGNESESLKYLYYDLQDT